MPPRALDRQQAALGNGAAIGGNLVRIAAGFEHPMARHDDHERVAGNRLRDRMRRTRGPELGCDFAIGAGFAARNRARELVNPQIEGGDVAGIERDVGEIGRLAAQRARQCPRSRSRHSSGGRSSRASGYWRSNRPRVSISRASGSCTPTTPRWPHAMPHRPIPVSNTVYPRPDITQPPQGHHSTAAKARIWKIRTGLRG